MDALSIEKIAHGIVMQCVDGVFDRSNMKSASSSENHGVEVKVEADSVVSKIKPHGTYPKKRKFTVFSWYERSYAIFMLLHRKIFNGDVYRASEMLGIARSTLQGYISTNVKKNVVPKWFDIVASLTWGVVKARYSKKIVAMFEGVDDKEQVNLSKFLPLRGKSVVLSKFCGVPPAKRAKLARKSAQAQARDEKSEVGNFTLVNKSVKNQYKARLSKYPAMVKKITDFVQWGWHSGAPVTRQACYMKAKEFCTEGDRFWKQYVNPEKDSAQTQLAHWLSRVLSKIGFSTRKETVSQSIPNNWKELSKRFSEETLEYLRRKEVNVVVTADQTFVRFLLANEDILVPTGVRRVGSNVKTDDERKGVTLMLTAFIWRNKATGIIKTGVLPPFMVFNGKTGKTLDRKYKDWS